MRIISKFHDYYDTAQGYGQDPTLIYRRDVRTVEFKRWPFDPVVPETLKFRPYWRDFLPQLTILGFCGRCFPIWLSNDFHVDAENLGRSLTRSFDLDFEDVVEEYIRVRAAGRLRSFSRGEDELVDRFRTAMSAAEGAPLKHDSFRSLECPSFLAIEHPRAPWSFWSKDATERMGIRVFTNPRLATLGLATRIDPFTAFQEISMFVGSMLTAEDDAPRTVGDDRTLAASKGFDEQSFRTQGPGQKKLNRKANKVRKRASSEDDKAG